MNEQVKDILERLKDRSVRIVVDAKTQYGYRLTTQ